MWSALVVCTATEPLLPVDRLQISALRFRFPAKVPGESVCPVLLREFLPSTLSCLVFALVCIDVLWKHQQNTVLFEVMGRFLSCRELLHDGQGNDAATW